MYGIYAKNERERGTERERERDEQPDSAYAFLSK